MASSSGDLPAELVRYVRQVQFAEIGQEGQMKLRQSSALLVGCGALGSVIAETLTRAGIGTLRLVDRDFVELNNLQRQVLYTEQDVARHLPKAIAAAEKLKQINHQVELDAHVQDVHFRNVQALVEGVDVILDGTDNFETRKFRN